MKERIRIYDNRYKGTDYLILLTVGELLWDIVGGLYTWAHMREKLSELSPYAVLPEEWPERPFPQWIHAGENDFWADYPSLPHYRR